MKVIELVRIGAEMMKKMSQFDIKIDDWRYLEAIEEFSVMRKEGVKYSYAVYKVSKKYGISESTLSRIIRKMRKDV